jgi:hypothetical protein
MFRLLPVLLLSACLPDFPKRDFVEDPTHDFDGDGVTELDGDCDDTSDAVFLGAPEICDGRDNDCDGRSDELEDADDGNFVTDAPVWYRDGDGDGYGEITVATADCEAPQGYTAEAGDCDDSRPTVHPGAQEYCNDGIDDDCDGAIDDADTDMVGDATWYRDADADGYGADDPDLAIESCVAPDGYVLNSDDCDDTDRRRRPGAAEVCDGIDNDCDDAIDDADPEGIVGPARWYADGDGDGYGNPLVWEEGCEASDGFTADNSDCDDERAESHPGAAEYCDERDNNCDGFIDEEGALDAPTYYVDSDGDGYGDPERPRQACVMPTFHSADGSDCDDGREEVHPGASERCDTAFDDDCDGTINDPDSEDCTVYFFDGDRDGYGDEESSRCQCTSDDAAALIAGEDPEPGYNVTTPGDCNDDDESVNPSAVESCFTAFDDDCDGSTNEYGAVGCSLWFLDEDGDGDGQSESVCSCEHISPYTADNDLDCDDTTAAIWTGADEVCGDGIDNNCEGTIDGSEAVDATEWYRDDDGDGYGLLTSATPFCERPDGYTDIVGDCDDTRDGVHPGVDNEDCLTFWDDDCSGTTNDVDADACTVFYADVDGDGFGVEGDSQCTCEADLVTDYTSRVTGDCDDSNPGVSPADAEICDDADVDEDCDGIVDPEGSRDCESYFYDGDGDGFGTADARCLCEASGYYDAVTLGDCDDTDSSINPDEENCGLRGFVGRDQASAVIEGRHAGTWMDGALTSLDYNRDGIADVAMGSPGEGRSDGHIYDGSGTVYLWLGPITGGRHTGSESDADLVFMADDLYQRGVGTYVTAGDVDGDGYDEILVGSSDIDAADYGSNTVYLIDDGLTGLGVVTPETSGVTSIPGNIAVLFDDINGDGFADGWVADEHYSSIKTGFLVYGDAEGLDVSAVMTGRDDSTHQIEQSCGSSSADPGCMNISTGDLDGDGFSDLVAYSYSNVVVWTGGPDWAGGGYDEDYGYCTSCPGISVSTIEPNEAVLRVVGDVSGDGLADVGVGWHGMDGSVDPYTGSYERDVGVIWVFAGGSDSTGDAALMGAEFAATSVEDAGFKILGERWREEFGLALGPVGDLDGDGTMDLFISADKVGEEGGPILWYGPTPMDGGVYSSTEAGAFFNDLDDQRSGIAPAGDVDSDGYDDFWAGGESVYLFHGAP